MLRYFYHHSETTFLAEVPERCDGIEGNILSLEKESTFGKSFNDLFRSIHSLNSGGGTIGLPIVTAISYQFEDMLLDIDGRYDVVNQDGIDTMLRYNDLLKSTAQHLVDKTIVYQEPETLITLDSTK